jgi:cytoskeletal protein RodZ
MSSLIAWLATSLAMCLLMENSIVWAGSPHRPFLNSELKSAKAIVIAQDNQSKAADETTDSSSDSKKSESRDPKDEKSAETPTKSLKNFTPSEKIEAEQAVDFPYDI